MPLTNAWQGLEVLQRSSLAQQPPEGSGMYLLRLQEVAWPTLHDIFAHPATETGPAVHTAHICLFCSMHMPASCTVRTWKPHAKAVAKHPILVRLLLVLAEELVVHLRALHEHAVTVRLPPLTAEVAQSGGQLCALRNNHGSCLRHAALFEGMGGRLWLVTGRHVRVCAR